MRNYKQDGVALDLVAPTGGVVSGNVYKIGSLIVVAAADAAQGATFVGYRLGVYTLPKATGAWTQGALLYWDDTAKNVTTTATSNSKIGVASAAALSGDTTGDVCLIPAI